MNYTLYRNTYNTAGDLVNSDIIHDAELYEKGDADVFLSHGIFHASEYPYSGDHRAWLMSDHEILWETGGRLQEQYTLHMTDVTPSSARRIYQYLRNH